jgi:hypothetical protein
VSTNLRQLLLFRDLAEDTKIRNPFLFWCDKQRGTLGCVVNPHTSAPHTCLLATGLKSPVELFPMQLFSGNGQVFNGGAFAAIKKRSLKNNVAEEERPFTADEWVFILEEGDDAEEAKCGGATGGISLWTASSGLVHTLLSDLLEPSCLYVTHNRDIIFIEKEDGHKRSSSSSDDGSSDDGFGVSTAGNAEVVYRVCAVQGTDVGLSLKRPAAERNAFLARRKKVLLTLSASVAVVAEEREPLQVSRVPCGVARLQDGSILVGFNVYREPACSPRMLGTGEGDTLNSKSRFVSSSSFFPSVCPSFRPSIHPIFRPSVRPSARPSFLFSFCPSVLPSSSFLPSFILPLS